MKSLVLLATVFLSLSSAYAGKRCARLYKGDYKTGRSIQLDSGDYENLYGSMNNSVSSLDVSAGCTVRLYDGENQSLQILSHTNIIGRKGDNEVQLGPFATNRASSASCSCN